VLLTLENLANRSQYLNARNTFDALLSLGVIVVSKEVKAETNLGDQVRDGCEAHLV
jgi:glutamate 5-kinase